ncbi:MAG: putative deacylase [Proteobacteria bacterium]|nr:putative deacylase [Pseudomonadota bacterium]
MKPLFRVCLVFLLATNLALACDKLESGLIAKGEPFQTEFHVCKGKAPGPVILVNGGIHGDEVAGIKAAEYFRSVRLHNGTLIVIPRMNRIASEKGVRFENIEFNHQFPGRADAKFYESRLAHALTRFIGERKPALILSLHESHLHRLKKGNKFGGQVIYYGVKPAPANLTGAIRRINAHLPEPDRHFVATYYPVNGATSEVWTALFGGEAYAIETWRGYALEERIALHKDVVRGFLQQMGMGLMD